MATPTVTPMTESSNPITLKLDLSSPNEMVDLFERCDLEVLRGPENSEFQSNSLLTSKTHHSNIEKVAKLIQKENTVVIFTGCGTSGRLGYVAATRFNQLKSLKNCRFRYLIAGHDKALLTSQEAHEDKPLEGIADLEKCIGEENAGSKNVVLIGITCGMSAPYVAGQLDFAIKTGNITPVLIGFNAVESARKIPIPTWKNRTFYSVAQDLIKNDKSIIINPSLGGEHVSGSSRMKGGSATKAILDAIFLCAVSGSKFGAEHFLKKMETGIVSHYVDNKREISRLIKHAGDSLMEGKSVAYFGRETFGALGLIDGTECKPTFGASLDDVRGFYEGGFKAMKNNDGDISSIGENFKVSFDDFRGLKNFNLGTSIILNEPEYRIEWPIESMPPTSFGFQLKPTKSDSQLDTIQQTLLNELLVKLSLNCISTGGHVLKGKVMQNFMIDVSLTNLKLFIRGREMVRRFVPGLTVDEAVSFLLKGIYNMDVLTPEILAKADEDHVASATQAAVEIGLCVPVAIILAAMANNGKRCSCEEARAMLQKESRVRVTLEGVLKN